MRRGSIGIQKFSEIINEINLNIKDSSANKSIDDLFDKKWISSSYKAFRIMEMQKRIESFHGLMIYVGLVKKDCSQWIYRNVTGDYQCIRFGLGKIVISSEKFPGCIRRNKRTFINEIPELMAILNDGRRLSGRRKIK